MTADELDTDAIRAREQGRLQQITELQDLLAAERARADVAEAEVERLRGWKAEALPVMSGLQEVGRALGVPLGRQITARAAVDTALDLRNRADSERARADGLLAAVKALADRHPVDYCCCGDGNGCPGPYLRALVDGADTGASA